MRAIVLVGMTWFLVSCTADWGSEPFPELADIPDPPERATSIEDKRAIAAEMASDLAEDEEETAAEGEEAAPQTAE